MYINAADGGWTPDLGGEIKLVQVVVKFDVF